MANPNFKTLFYFFLNWSQKVLASNKTLGISYSATGNRFCKISKTEKFKNSIEKTDYIRDVHHKTLVVYIKLHYHYVETSG